MHEGIQFQKGLYAFLFYNEIPGIQDHVLSESLMHLALRLIFRRRRLNFINVRTAYASKIQAPPTKNPLANSGTMRFREHMVSKWRKQDEKNRKKGRK